jgi:HEAT repeat protein
MASAELEALLKKIPDPDPDVHEILKAAGIDEKELAAEMKADPKAAEAKVTAAVVKARPDLANLHIRPDKGKITGMPYPEAEKVFEDILKGGKDNINGLIDMLVEVDDGKDFKPRYALHCLAVYTARPDKKAQKDIIIEALTAGVEGSKPKPIRLYLLRQLQVCGDKRVVALLGKCLADEDFFEAAATALLAIDPALAAEQFRAALPSAKGKARLTMIQDLGMVKDAPSAAAIRQAIGDSDEAVRIAAAGASAILGDAEAVDAVIKAAGATGVWERIRMTDAALLLAENLLAAGKKDPAVKIYTYLKDSRKDEPESYIRNAAAKALTEMK